MASLADEVRLLIGGKYHAGWDSYLIESDLLTPADAWRVSLGFDGGRIPAAVVSGAPVEIRIGGDRAMTGRIDRIGSSVAKGRAMLHIDGRDMAGQLVDCSAPIFTAQLISLADIAKTILQPFGYKVSPPDAENLLTREKVNVEPGDSAWDALQHAAEANGLWAWMEPDGSLTIGGPDYSAAPVATLVMKLPPNAGGNNVESFELDDAIADSYSEVTVLAQTHGGGATRTANNAVKGSYKDPSVPFYRPKIVIDHESDTPKHAEEFARKLAMDSRLRRWTLRSTVSGHRINAPGMPGDGKLWAPGMRVNVIDETHGLNVTCFLMARSFSGGRGERGKTVLTLKEDGVWIIAAHPHKLRHRRGKNGPGRIWNMPPIEAGQ